MNAENLLILVSVTLLLSYISSLIYTKTKIPDIILLMGFGIIVGPVLHLIDVELFIELAPLMSILALSIILFEAGINLDLVTLFEYMGKSLILSATSIITSIILVGYVVNFVLPSEFTLLQAMLLGAMIGGTSTVSVFGILSGLGKTIPNLTTTRVLLTMESIVSDPFCIIASITLIRMVMLPSVSIWDSLKEIYIIFILSSILGIVMGLFWARVLNRLRGRPFTYMITLAFLLPTYIISEEFVGAGGGALTALAFGLAISNYKYIMDRLGVPSRIMIDKQKLREFHEEITFFIKSFFFVYIGLVVTLSLKTTFIGLGITLILMAMRYLLVDVLNLFINFTTEEKVLSQFVYASGLPAFVMSQLPLIFDPTGQFFVNASIYPDLCMPIVLGTVIYSAIVSPIGVRQALSRNIKSKLAEESEVTDS